MIHHLDLDSLSHIFSYIPSNQRGISVQKLKTVSKYFYNLFHPDEEEDIYCSSLYTEYFREVFGCMFVPIIYIQLCHAHDNSLLMSSMESIFQDKCEIISEKEFQIECNLPKSENEYHILDNLEEYINCTESESQHLLTKRSNKQLLKKNLLDWKLNSSKNSLTQNNFTLFSNLRKNTVNAFRLIDKFKFHFQITPYGQSETEICTAKWFNTIYVATDSIRKDFDIKEDMITIIGDSIISLCNQILYMAFVKFSEYAEKYGEFKLSHIYNDQDVRHLERIAKAGTFNDLIDFLTINRNIMLHFTNSFLSNNTNLIRYTSIWSKELKTNLHSALGIIENLSLIPWDVMRDKARLKLSSIILYHVFRDEMNISPEYLSKLDHAPNNNQIAYTIQIMEFKLHFLTLNFNRTKGIFRKNIVSIPRYPGPSLKYFSHNIPLDDIVIIPTNLDSLNECCLKYCTFNTISAPLWCVPCCCWWGSMACCCLYPCCYELDCKTIDGCGFVSQLFDSRHRTMSCLDADVGLFVSATTLCYPFCLLKMRTTNGPCRAAVKSWTIREDKIFGNSSCSIL